MGIVPAGDGLARRATPTSRRGTRSARMLGPFSAACRRSSPASRPIPMRRSAAWSTPSSAWRCSTTRVVVVMSDNGASGEGGAFGSENEYRYFLGLAGHARGEQGGHRPAGRPLDSQSLSGRLGAGRQHAAQVVQEVHLRRRHSRAADRALAGRDRDAAGEIRQQFHHVIDIAPTVLDLAGVPAPTVYPRPGAAPPARHLARVQLRGAGRRGRSRRDHAVFRDGRPARHLPRRLEGGDQAIKAVRRTSDDVWELYHLPDDYSETRDLAAGGAGAPSRRSWRSGGTRPDATMSCRSTTAPRRAPSPAIPDDDGTAQVRACCRGRGC